MNSERQQRSTASANKVTVRRRSELQTGNVETGSIKRRPASAQRKTRPRKTRRKAKGHFRLLHIPSWSVLAGGILFAVLLVTLFYYFFIDPFSFRWKAIYGEGVYPSGYSVHGIDISRYQGIVDWEILRNADIKNVPVSFVFMKGTEGVSIVDDNFNLNFYESRKNGLLRGVYHFYTPDVDGRRQAEFFMKQVHLEPGDLPPVLDVEKAGELTVSQLQREVRKWLDLVEQRYGVKPIIYSGYKFKQKYLSDSVFNQYPFWIAHYYVEKLAYRGKWHFWQYTDCGQVAGIKGPVDCNIFNGTMDELMELVIPEEEDTDIFLEEGR